MARRDKRRRRARKQRREEREERRNYRAAGQLAPQLRSDLPESRDPRTRWRGLRARGGLDISFVPTELVVDLGELDDEAPLRLVAALFEPPEADA
jgi:hypothetical protein